MNRILPAVLCSAALLLSACSSGGDGEDAAPTGPATPTGPVASTDPAGPADPADAVVTGLDAPWSVAFTGDGVPLVSERDSARVLRIADGAAVEMATLDGVEPRGEGGLLGITVHDGYLYAYATTATDNRVTRYPLDDLRLGTPEVVIDGLPKGVTHNGGRLAVGPDGMLYGTVGDAGDREKAQDEASVNGTILRITLTGDVPADNPFPGSPVYSYGHRNVQGIGWAPDGTMYASEFGQDTWDELNIIEAGGNHGWPVVEGIGGRQRFTDPVQQWPTGAASPSGIAVTRDAVWIANLRGERLREVPLSDPSTADEHHVGEYGRLRDVVLTPDGELWALTNNTDGRGSPAPDDDRIIRVP